jgi:hypothetical protein
MRMIFGAIGGMKIDKGNRSTRRKPTPAPLCPPQNPTWQTRSRSPDRSGGKPATNRLSYGADFFLVPFRCRVTVEVFDPASTQVLDNSYWNGKNVDWISSGIILGTIQKYAWRDWRRPWTTSVRRTVLWRRFEPGTLQTRSRRALTTEPWCSVAAKLHASSRR